MLATRRRFDPRRGSEKTWVYAIALNCLRDNARRSAAERRALERSSASPSASTSSDDGAGDASIGGVHDRDLIRRGLERLSTDERLAVALRFGGDLTMPEIAKLVREPVTTVEARIYRALRKLRAELG